jgi:hypothetical protein
MSGWGYRVLLAVLAVALFAPGPAAAQRDGDKPPPGKPAPKPKPDPPGKGKDKDKDDDEASQQLRAAVGCDLLDPAACLLPWPNDLFTRPDPSTATGRRLNLQLHAMPRNAAGKPIDPTDFNHADGFSPGQMIVTKVPGLDNMEAFQNTGAVPITDIGRTHDEDQAIVVINARTKERHLIWSEIDSNAGCPAHEEPTAGPCDPADANLLVRPAQNWEEGERYIVALRNLKDADGNAIEPQAAFKAYRDRELLADLPPLSLRKERMESIFKSLKGAGIEREELYLAWDFTVASSESIAGRMLHIRDDAFAQLGDHDLSDLKVEGDPPAFAVSGVTDFATGAIARQVSGTFTVPCYLDKPQCVPAQSRFLIDPTTGKPARLPENTYEANFICRIPRWALDADGGARPTRPSLYGHGLFGGASEVGAGNVGAMADEHGFTFCATDWIGMATTDVPNALAVEADLSGFPTLADRVQQGMLNFLYLGRLMVHPQGFNAHPDFQLGGEGVIDTTRLFYDGNSQGGIIGGALAAVAPDYTRAALGVPGMNYSTLLRRSVDFVARQDPQDPASFVGYSTPMYAAYPNELERPLILSMIQMLWDRAEANGYAHHMTTDPLPDTPAHDVLLHVAFGDHQVAPVTAEVEARTIGARVLRKPMFDPGHHPDVDPFFGLDAFDAFPGTGSALVVWDSGTPAPPTANVPPRPEWGYGRDPHADPRNEPRARLQKSEFLKVGGAVVDTCEGGPCYARGHGPSSHGG